MATRLPPTSDEDPFAKFLADHEIERGRPLRDQAYALLREAIVTGRLQPLAAVNEVDIAMRLGISRTPVREAVKQISDEGLVQVFAQNGTFVAGISRRQVEQAYLIRIALERESVRRAARTITEEQIEGLEDCIAAQELAISRSRFDTAIRQDDAFHRGIAEANRLDMVWKVIDISKAQMDRCRMLSLPSPGAGHQTIDQHRAIIAALRGHDVEAADAAMRDHLETSMANTFAYLDARDAESEA